MGIPFVPYPRISDSLRSSSTGRAAHCCAGAVNSAAVLPACFSCSACRRSGTSRGSSVTTAVKDAPSNSASACARSCAYSDLMFNGTSHAPCWQYQRGKYKHVSSMVPLAGTTGALSRQLCVRCMMLHGTINRSNEDNDRHAAVFSRHRERSRDPQ